MCACGGVCVCVCVCVYVCVHRVDDVRNNELQRTNLMGEKLCNVKEERYPHFRTQLPPKSQTIETL